jgi:hypothetical protein
MFRRIHKFDVQERNEAVEILIGSFLDSPIFVHAIPDPGIRKSALRYLFLASLNDAVKFGVVDVLEEERILSIFVYYPPRRYPPSFMRNLRALPSYLQLMRLSLKGVWRLYRAQRFFDAIRPNVPHCHALFLAATGNGKSGARLIRHSLATIDANKWPVYLETQDPRTTKLYSRFGSKVLQQKAPFPGAPMTWTMWRPSARVASFPRVDRLDPIGEKKLK